MTVWIVRDDFGYNAPRTPTEVTNMVNEVNKIYEQIGVNFYIDSISFTNRKEWIDLTSENGSCNITLRNELVNIERDTNGFELYFIDSISARAVANADIYGIVLSTNAIPRGLAHELGHAFGCADVYHIKKSDRKTPIVNNLPSFSTTPQDWNNGSGVRYYKIITKQSTLIRTVLMCGYQYPHSIDLTAGSLSGFTIYDQEGLADIGFFRSGQRRNPIYHK